MIELSDGVERRGRGVSNSGYAEIFNPSLVRVHFKVSHFISHLRLALRAKRLGGVPTARVGLYYRRGTVIAQEDF